MIYDEEILRNRFRFNYWFYCKLKFEKCPYDLSEEEIYILNYKYNLLSDSDKKLYDKKINNIRLRKYRLRKRIDFLLKNYDCSFVTFTLNDEHINIDCHILRTRICEILRDLGCYFIGNIDFGSEHERLHFHFIVGKQGIKKILKERYASEKGLNYGFVDYKNITNKNSYRLSNYIDKLVNHSLKVSTWELKKANIITSRGLYSFTNILSLK